jgi:hypothetical protein
MQPSRENDPDPSESALDVIAEARRPVIIERHRPQIEEMESSLSDAFITGASDNPRLQAMLKELEADSEKARIAKTIKTLVDDGHYKDSTLRQALVDELCLLRESASIEVATLQLHVIGVYRTLFQKMSEHREPPTLNDLRDVPMPMISRVLNPISAEFGSLHLHDSLAYTPAEADRCLRFVRRLHKAEGGDGGWSEAAGEPRLRQEVEDQLTALPETDRVQARKIFVRDRIRSRFYRGVFVKYFNRDELDPAEIEAHQTILHWLQSIERTPHLYPFMQGQSSSQKIFRLAQLQTKLMQLHEMYARIAAACQHPNYQETFKDKHIRDRLALMAKDHFPPLTLTTELTLGVMLCPFASFVTWIQDKTASQEFVLPPDPKS